MKPIFYACSAEALGSFAIVLLGFGCLGLLKVWKISFAQGTAALVFGLIIMGLIYTLGHYSNAHFNPAVTLGALVSGQMPVMLALAYCGSQILGGLAAGLCLRLLSFP